MIILKLTMEDEEMQKFSKHEKIAFKSTIIAILLLIISVCPGGYAEVTGILQGIATGLLSGTVLLFISGIKERDRFNLNAVYSNLNELNSALTNIYVSYDTLYHKTYHGKKEKMSYEEYLKIIIEAFDEYKESNEKLSNICINLVPNNTQIKDYTNLLNNELVAINKALHIAQEDISNKKCLDDLVHRLFELQYLAFELYLENIKNVKEVNSEIMHINNSLI